MVFGNVNGAVALFMWLSVHVVQNIGLPKLPWPHFSRCVSVVPLLAAHYCASARCSIVLLLDADRDSLDADRVLGDAAGSPVCTADGHRLRVSRAQGSLETWKVSKGAGLRAQRVDLRGCSCQGNSSSLAAAAPLLTSFLYLPACGLPSCWRRGASRLRAMPTGWHPPAVSGQGEAPWVWWRCSSPPALLKGWWQLWASRPCILGGICCPMTIYDLPVQ